MNRTRRWMCGTPQDECGGAMVMLDGLHASIKAHGSPQDAFKCYVRHLLRQGYVRKGGREFQLPGHPILVLTKTSRFGTMLCPGKPGGAASGSTISTNRWRFYRRIGRGAVTGR